MQLLDKAVELRGSQVLNMQTYRGLLLRRRFMALATLLAWVAVGLLIAALATPNWAVIKFVNNRYQNVKVQLGVWGEWRTLSNTTHSDVEWIPHFPTPPEHVLRLAGATLKHYYRAQAAIGVIALFMLLSTNCLALYTFYHHRYMYKRLTAGLYIFTGMAILVSIEVLTSSVDEWNTAAVSNSHIDHFEFDAAMTIGYSTRLAQSVIAICVFAAICFAVGSHKQKGDMAATADLEIEDRPVHIGR